MAKTSQNAEKMAALAALQNAAEGSDETQNINEPDDQEFDNESEHPNILDGLFMIEKDLIPQRGVLYPTSWEFAQRCPTSKEIANLSTVNEQDQPAVMAAMEDIIRKCVVIYDTDKDKQISSGEICDAHRMFFILKLRELYLSNSPLTYPSTCSVCHDTYDSELSSFNLVYTMPNDSLLNVFDGRKFVLDMGLETPIVFTIPTIEISGRIFKYLVRAYRDANSDKKIKKDMIAFDKPFLLLAPYLYETGKESIKELYTKFQDIKKDDKRFKAYLNIVNKIKFENEDYLNSVCPHCQALEEPALRFPGGFKNLFVDDTDNTGYFE